MGVSIRQKWDTVNDRPSTKRTSLVDEHRAWQRANAQPIPEFRAKFVKLPYGQSEVSVTPANRSHVINARMGFNPLLDCPRKRRTPEEQVERDKENRQRAAKQARIRVRHLVKSIAADHMLTFSYRENVTDREKIAADWKRFVRIFRYRYPDWKYVAVHERQDRGAFHFHVAVAGRQDIRWLLRCWLIAIGQPEEDVSAWLVRGIKLGDGSLGAVNVEAPNRRWGGGMCKQWKRDKLASYLTKYIGKEFEDTAKGAKKYWHSRNIERPVVERFWLRATTYLEAIREAHDLVYYTGATSLSMWGDCSAQVIWITGETSRERLGMATSQSPELELIED